MLIENHTTRLSESLEMIQYAVTHGPQHPQRTLGFHLSAAAVDLLNLYLHKEGFTTSSEDINHRWLRSAKKTKEKIPFDFPKKTKLLSLIQAIEDVRDPFCYGVPRAVEEIERTLILFRDLLELFRRLGIDEAQF